MLIALKIEYWWKKGDDQLIYRFSFPYSFKFMEKYLALLSLLNLHQRRLNDVKHTSRNFSAHPVSQKNGGALVFS